MLKKYAVLGLCVLMLSVKIHVSDKKIVSSKEKVSGFFTLQEHRTLRNLVQDLLIQEHRTLRNLVQYSLQDHRVLRNPVNNNNQQK